KPYSRVRLLQGYLKEFEGLYETFRTKGLAPILMRWKELAEIIGRQIQVDLLGQKVAGRVLDVDRSGALIIRNPQGERQRIFSGDITLLPPQRPAGRRNQGHES
ncbi:MAG: hypothetical protein NTY64_14055, partial [Deltaproteobacteria bacterium]|nr:hypothetical protein [Deltaproteobacteria bacterium]